MRFIARFFCIDAALLCEFESDKIQINECNPILDEGGKSAPPQLVFEYSSETVRSRKLKFFCDF